MKSKREQALQGLFLCLQNGLSDVAVTRNDPVPIKIPKTGLMILRDGDPGEPEVTLSRTQFYQTVFIPDPA